MSLVYVHMLIIPGCYFTKLIGGICKLVPKLTYFVLERELLNLNETAPRFISLG